MQGWLRRLGLALMLIAGAVPALAQWSTKPEPLPPRGSSYAPQQAPMAPAPSAGPQQGQRPQRCAQPLADGCMRMQSSCQMACPGIWSSNPSAPAFTPTDRAGCMQRCLTQYQRCMTQYSCW